VKSRVTAGNDAGSSFYMTVKANRAQLNMPRYCP
jgi:hypothetical protein